MKLPWVGHSARARMEEGQEPKVPSGTVQLAYLHRTKCGPVEYQMVSSANSSGLGGRTEYRPYA